MRAGPFDAILLDAGLSDMDGGDLCRLLRSEGVRSPVILLTAPGGSALVDAGVTECLARPFRFGVLLARLRALLRQVEQAGDGELTIGPYCFRPAVKLLADAVAGRTVRLTEKETAILKYLCRAGHKAVSYTHLTLPTIYSV